MKSWHIYPIALLGVFSALASANESSSPRPLAEAASPTSAISAKPASAKPTLMKGMSSDEIVQAIGRPQKTKTMAKPNDNAEVWTYRRKTGEHSRQVVTGTRMVQRFGGMATVLSGGMTSAPELVYGMERVKTFQVTSLLLVDGKLVVAKQWNEQETELD